MKLIIIGCEYSGTSTLARNVFDWVNEKMDGGMLLFHDHWKIPFTSGHQEHDPPLALDDEELEQVSAMSPKLKEMYQRYSLYYHIAPGALRGPHYMAVGLHIEESIYGPVYFGYGIKGPWPIGVERRVVQDIVEDELLEFAPDMTLVLLNTSSEIIASRMRDAPHPRQIVPEKDIELVSARFEEEFERSKIRNKITLDSGAGTPEETLAEFLKQYEPFMSDSDKVRILVNKAKQSGDWL